METVLTRYVGRSIVTDGTFVYNCGYEDVWERGVVKRLLSDTAILGVVGRHEKITPPKRFCGHAVKLVGRMRIYEKGPEFPREINGWACLPTKFRPDTWDMLKRYYPDSRALVQTAQAPREVILGKCRIEYGAFLGTDVEKVVFEDSPRKIQNNTFRDCSQLEQLELAPGLERIGSYAFAGCKSLKWLVLPDTVNHLQEGAFCGCGLETVVLSPAMTRLNDKVFADCPHLKTVVMPPSIRQISNTAFKNSLQVQIAGFKNSSAERFCQSRGIDFLSLEETLHAAADGAKPAG